MTFLRHHCSVNTAQYRSSSITAPDLKLTFCKVDGLSVGLRMAELAN